MLDSRTISVFIADDHALIRQGLEGILAHTPGMRLAGHAKDGLEAVQLALSKKPDVILMDLQMPRMNGLDASQKILRKNKKMKIIILTASEKPDYLRQARKIGAQGYLIKSTMPKEMIAAIRTVAQGGHHFQQKPIPLCSPLAITETEGLGKLSPKEKEVLNLLLKGIEVPAIARMLHREERTIRTHRESIRQKLGVDNDSQLILWATKAGYTDHA